MSEVRGIWELKGLWVEKDKQTSKYTDWLNLRISKGLDQPSKGVNFQESKMFLTIEFLCSKCLYW